MSENIPTPAVAEAPVGPIAAIAAQARLRPQAEALLDVDGARWTLADLDARRCGWALELEPSRGDARPVTAVALPAGPAYVAAVLAAATAGVAVPCGLQERTDELVRAFEATAVTVLLTTAPVAPALAEAARLRRAASSPSTWEAWVPGSRRSDPPNRAPTSSATRCARRARRASPR